jgi:hypothetical protein
MRLTRIFTIAAALAMLPASGIAAPEKGGSLSAAQNEVKLRLDQLELKYEIDKDGDFKVVYNYSDEKRTQLIWVSGSVEEAGPFRIREIYSPAASIKKDGVTGAKALELMAEASSKKLGDWEVRGDGLYYVLKLAEPMSAEQLKKAMDIAAEVADDTEIKFSGKRDEL